MTGYRIVLIGETHYVLPPGWTEEDILESYGQHLKNFIMTTLNFRAIVSLCRSYPERKKEIEGWLRERIKAEIEARALCRAREDIELKAA